MASLSLKNIYKVYPGGVTAVTDFCLKIEDKESIILVGPSGCGKPTTLRTIAGLEEISKGGLYIGDKLFNDIAPKDRDIVMMFRNYALYPHTIVFDNMAFSLKLRKIPKDEIKRRVEEATHILDISHLLDRKPKAFSGDQRQRVTLGRAVARDPKVFLLGEPLSNLDAELRAQMRAEIAKLHKRLGTTFIYVTHDQTEAITMADRIAVMKDGSIQQVDTSQNLYERPVSEFVAGFMGLSQMNFLDAVLGKDGAQHTLTFDKTTVKVPQSKTEGTPLDEYIGKTVTFSVCPEDVYDEPQSLAESQDSLATADVEVTELMSVEVYLYLNCEGSSLTAHVGPASTAKPGDRVNIALDMMKCHIFDKGTELAILN